MASWSIEIPLGTFLLDFSWMGVLLIVATLLRRHVTPLQEYLIPNNLLAGFLGLLLGMNGFQLIDLESDRLGSYVYHLLALLFIAISLRAPKKAIGLTPVKFSVIFLLVYLFQAIVGMIGAFFLIFTFMPDLFPGIGLLMPLAYGMNPGIAFSIGQNWEVFGFTSGSIVGLTFSAIGFIIAYGVGIHLVRKGIKNGQATYLKNSGELTDEIKTGILSPHNRQSGGHITTAPEAIESLSLHLGLIGFTYTLTYLFTLFLEYGLISTGAEKELSTLWSFHFILAALIALFVRKGVDAFKLDHWIDDTTMTRLANLFMDFMIVASVAAISFKVINHYIIPLLLLSISVGITTWVVIKVATKSMFTDHQLERYVTIFGNMTGTLQSALVLLRVLDSKLKSPVSYDLVYGSGITLVLGFPLLILINAPVNYFDDLVTGFAYVTIALCIYLGFMLLGWNYLRKR